ncbi:conserved hypothetical protein of the UPF0029 family [Candidatus Kinetoplastibacterium blastocrithidii TCC012E]|uniref:Impact N-terminal domain-containing protein n=1 Tax=Candidatus Kinetoplastidibacterium blastocrithidiae TCC012E TaxID=1208922 RepID=M1LB62_9PROT|nr:YigZ family protein [Candidatus Kinetoplastibacterium blastocrithidii]AFZ83575.1 hypothetical protein CKBE_00386 [Candidatus Kinetoplastibacterium blastocrithidii (ex Strigomonas culicis)]AGF49693.1 conserved hypothetical protein of the UPF0029 family [Candidatus Kinetoplastibacterium blastocrithidii TCC012E]
MRTIDDVCKYVKLVKKSRFLVKAVSVNHVYEADNFLCSNKNSLATHNCWAYRINDLYRFCDDKEPFGTAGRPILQAIDGLKLNKIAVLVARWFGGVKLGKGGLMRAYKSSVEDCLSQVNLIEIIDTVIIKCILSVKDAHIIYNPCESISIISDSFNNDSYEFVIKIQKDKVGDLKNRINKLSKDNSLFYCLDSTKTN